MLGFATKGPFANYDYSDIIAEISELQPSAITDYQNDIMYPSGVFESFEGTALPQEPSSQNMFIYSGQIHLRIILNDAHNSLYGKCARSSVLLPLLKLRRCSTWI